MSDTKHIRALMAAATPGPWKQVDERAYDTFISAADGVLVADTETVEQAALIVALVNSAEELLDKADKYDAMVANLAALVASIHRNAPATLGIAILADTEVVK